MRRGMIAEDIIAEKKDQGRRNRRPLTTDGWAGGTKKERPARPLQTGIWCGNQGVASRQAYSAGAWDAGVGGISSAESSFMALMASETLSARSP